MIFELRYNGGEKALLRGEVCEELKERIPKSQTIILPKVDSLEKTLMLGKTEGRRRRGQQRMRWLMAPLT